MTTTFDGQQPLAAAWKNAAGDDLSTGADYTVVDDVSAANGPYTLSLLIKTVSGTTPASFKIVLNLRPDCTDLFTDNEYTETVELEILG